MRNNFSALVVFVISLLSFGNNLVHAASKNYTVALVSDGTLFQYSDFQQELVDELITLTEGEFELTLKEFEGDWTRTGIQNALQQAYQDPDVDMLLVTGLAANQLGISLTNYPKPTFLPLVLDLELINVPNVNGTSGTRNLQRY